MCHIKSVCVCGIRGQLSALSVSQAPGILLNHDIRESAGGRWLTVATTIQRWRFGRDLRQGSRAGDDPRRPERQVGEDGQGLYTHTHSRTHTQEMVMGLSIDV